MSRNKLKCSTCGRRIYDGRDASEVRVRPEDDQVKFWACWKFHGSRPTHRHATKQSAINEAKRIHAQTKEVILVVEVVGGVFPQLDWVEA